MVTEVGTEMQTSTKINSVDPFVEFESTLPDEIALMESAHEGCQWFDRVRVQVGTTVSEVWCNSEVLGIFLRSNDYRPVRFSEDIYGQDELMEIEWAR